MKFLHRLWEKWDAWCDRQALAGVRAAFGKGDQWKVLQARDVLLQDYQRILLNMTEEERDAFWMQLEKGVADSGFHRPFLNWLTQYRQFRSSYLKEGGRP